MKSRCCLLSQSVRQQQIDHLKWSAPSHSMGQLTSYGQITALREGLDGILRVEHDDHLGKI